MSKKFQENGRRRGLDDASVADGLGALVSYLADRGHAPVTVASYGRAASHFFRWIAQRGSRRRIGDESVGRFLVHLRRCRCRQAGPRSLFTVRAALKHLMVVLRRRGLVAPPKTTRATRIDRVLTAFENHLRDTCGLAEATRIYRRRYVREFLLATFGGGPIDARRIAPADLVRFVTRCARSRRPGSVQVIAGCVKSFLRFQQLLGACGPEMASAVPRIPEYRLARLPMILSDAQVDGVLSSCNLGTIAGRRDFAILRCLVDLGLRADEVGRLHVDDIDWRASVLRLRGTKVRRSAVLPLPGLVGRAIADYLRHARPTTAARALFLRDTVPVGRPVDTSMVRRISRRAAARAGLAGPLARPHALRHTAASRMLRGGVTLKEVADVLRHSTIDTTAIYAKVDLPRLISVALPWPRRSP